LDSTSESGISSPRIVREERTIYLMIGLYCRANHHSDRVLCEECRQLFDYAHARLMHCPFAPEKPTCAKCPVHCYKKDKRERIRQVMRYSGPRMILHHPILIIRHILDERISGSKNPKNIPGSSGS
jgi:hypothetical protein